MAELRERDTLAARALELAVLTAARTGEILGATWGEIDFATKTWVIPARRMKAGRQHRVPLGDRAIAILSTLPREDARIFPIGSRALPRLHAGWGRTFRQRRHPLAVREQRLSAASRRGIRHYALIELLKGSRRPAAR